jgi:eukaryotic-like serine/threonine-protein kinase
MLVHNHGDDIEPRLDQLLHRWEELQQQGESRSPEELCSTCPELAGELARRIALLRAFDPLLTDSTIVCGENPRLGPASGLSRESATARADYGDLRFHAAGGLGEVFLARNAELNREVALKFLKPNRTRDPASLRRFLQEAEVTGRLEHPGVVPIYALGTDSRGAPCYAMRFIRGATFQNVINGFHAAERTGRDPSERSLALRELLNRFVSICNTVAYAHSRGNIHRDLKPLNVMLGKYDETLVVDWGLAKPFERNEEADGASEEALTPGSGSDSPTVRVVGTLAYMSPEQAQERPAEVGPPSDIFSLGAILYAILTGAAPYRSGAHDEVLERVRCCEFPSPRQIKPLTPRALEAICSKAMAKESRDRYGNALELAADVKRWLADEPVMDWREPIWLGARRWMRRHRTLVTSAAAVLVLSLAGLAGFTSVLAGKNRQLDQQRLRAEAREALAIDAVKQFRDAIQANAELKNRPGIVANRKFRR